MVPEIIAEVQITYSSKVKACDRFRVTGSKDAAAAFRSIWPSYEHIEFIYMLMLNRQNQVLGIWIQVMRIRKSPGNSLRPERCWKSR
jgi:hypothetical protein